MYLTYDEYKGFGGALSESAFNATIYDAQAKVDYYTYNRLVKDTVVSYKVKQAIFKIVNLLDTFNNYKNLITDIDNPIAISQSNDGVSVSFGGYLGNTTPQDLVNAKKELDIDILNVLKVYLSGEKNQVGQLLLYRGVY